MKKIILIIFLVLFAAYLVNNYSDHPIIANIIHPEQINPEQINHNNYSEQHQEHTVYKIENKQNEIQSFDKYNINKNTNKNDLIIQSGPNSILPKLLSNNQEQQHKYQEQHQEQHNQQEQQHKYQEQHQEQHNQQEQQHKYQEQHNQQEQQHKYQEQHPQEQHPQEQHHQEQQHKYQEQQHKYQEQHHNHQEQQQEYGVSKNNNQKCKIYSASKQIDSNNIMGLLDTNPSAGNDYNIEGKSFEDKYWNFNNNDSSLLDGMNLDNNRFFTGYYNVPASKMKSKDDTIYNDNNEFTPLKLNYEGDNYTKYAIATNKYYNISFIVYEKETYFDEPALYNNKLYNYLLCSVKDGKLKIMNPMQPRNRILMGEFISFSFGVSQLNFLLITPI